MAFVILMSRVPLLVLTCCALTFASFFQSSSADAIVSPMATAADQKLLDAYEAAGGVLNAVDLVCYCGVVMLALTFFERVGRAPTRADSASSANVLQELRIQSTASGAPAFAKHTLAHWVERHKARNFQKQLVAQTDITAEDAMKIARKMEELEWSKRTFEMAAAGLARVRKLYEAASALFQAAVAKEPGGVFTETFPQLASGLEDTRDSYELVRGGINRWQQFSIRRRTLEWQNLYEQSPQGLYDMLMGLNQCEFETSIWLRELGKLREACESDSKLDPQGPFLRLDANGQPDLLSGGKPDPQEVKIQLNHQGPLLRLDAHGQPDLLSDVKPDPQKVKQD